MPSTEYFLSEIDQPGLPDNVFFGDVIYEAGGTHGPRLQTNYQLLFIDSGHVQVEIDGQTHGLVQGHMAFLKPGHNAYQLLVASQGTAGRALLASHGAFYRGDCISLRFQNGSALFA